MHGGHFGADDDHHHASGSGLTLDHHSEEDPAETLGPGAAWLHDNIELVTVGIDIGSSTSHLMFGHVQLQRLSQSLSSSYVVVQRDTLWQSGIRLTPYLSSGLIDATALQTFINGCYAEANLTPDGVDTGVVVLTGEALKRRNAEAIASLFSKTSGKFVCALAGHHREAVMAAHGSGAADLSRQLGKVVLNVDIGGGTTKFALIKAGELLSTAALAVGGRLLVTDSDERITWIADPLRKIASALDVALAVGQRISVGQRQKLAAQLAELVVELIEQRPSQLANSLLLTSALSIEPEPDLITFSGGVAEYIYGREEREYDDLGRLLGNQIGHALSSNEIHVPCANLAQGIRATVVGLSQFSIQVSGNTLAVDDQAILPLRNVPVAQPPICINGQSEIGEVARLVTATLERSEDARHGPVAVAVRWEGDPEYQQLYTLTEGLRLGLANWSGNHMRDPLVLMVDRDVARSLGYLLRTEVSLGRPVVCLDGIGLEACDYVDVGQLIRPAHVVPVIVKSLLFASNSRASSGR